MPITGLEYHNVPNTTKYYILATTPHRMYQFQVRECHQNLILRLVYAALYIPAAMPLY